MCRFEIFFLGCIMVRVGLLWIWSSLHPFSIFSCPKQDSFWARYQFGLLGDCEEDYFLGKQHEKPKYFLFHSFLPRRNEEDYIYVSRFRMRRFLSNPSVFFGLELISPCMVKFLKLVEYFHGLAMESVKYGKFMSYFIPFEILIMSSIVGNWSKRCKKYSHLSRALL